MSIRDRITHPLNVSYLVVGLVFLGIAASWALRTAGLVDTRQMGWLLPLLLVAAGAVGLVAATARSISRDRPARDIDEAADDALDHRPEQPVADPFDWSADDRGEPR
jgi:hypothetical protein